MTQIRDAWSIMLSSTHHWRKSLFHSSMTLWLPFFNCLQLQRFLLDHKYNVFYDKCPKMELSGRNNCLTGNKPQSDRCLAEKRKWSVNHWLTLNHLWLNVTLPGEVKCVLFMIKSEIHWQASQGFHLISLEGEMMLSAEPFWRSNGQSVVNSNHVL